MSAEPIALAMLERYHHPLIRFVATNAVLLSIVAVLAVFLCVSIGLLGRATAIKRRAREKAWSSGPRSASAILPQVEKLRANNLSGAPGTARSSASHRCLIISARHLVSQLAYFRRVPVPNTDSSDHKTRKNE